MLFYFYAGRVEYIDGGGILNKGVDRIGIVSLADQLRDFVIILFKLFLSSLYDHRFFDFIEYPEKIIRFLLTITFEDSFLELLQAVFSYAPVLQVLVLIQVLPVVRMIQADRLGNIIFP